MFARSLPATLCLLSLAFHGAAIRAEADSPSEIRGVHATASWKTSIGSFFKRVATDATSHLPFAATQQAMGESGQDVTELEMDEALQMVRSAMDDQYRELDRLWVRADCFYWWMEASGVPLLATIAPPGDDSGAITNPNATIVLGIGRLDTNGRFGVRTEISDLVSGATQQSMGVSGQDAPPEPEIDKAVQVVPCDTDDQHPELDLHYQMLDLDRLWVRADCLYWWMEAYGVPPLATTVPDGGGSGTLTNPNSTIVLGNGRLDTDGRFGVRTEIGYLLFPLHMVSIQADFFVLEQGGSSAGVAATNGTSLYRPFYDANPGFDGPNAEGADTFDVSSSSQVASGGISLRKQICCRCYDPHRHQKGGKGFAQKSRYPCWYTIDLLGGYRSFGVDETLTMHETASYPPVNPNTFFDLTDRFETKNRFHGGELGIVAQCHRGPWALESVLKVALGNNHEEVIISGQSITTTVPPTTTEIRGGGFFANPSNIGRYTEDHFAAIPQLQLNLRRQVTQCLSVSFGYTFLYISDLVRPGDQIDFAVDGRWLDPNFVPPGVPPAVHPEPKFERSDAWLQGVNLGLTWNY